MRKHHSVFGGVALVLALATTACGGEDTDPEVKETATELPSTTPTSTPTPQAPEEKAAVQLTTYLEVRDTAQRKRTIDFKALNPVATGEAFLQLQDTVANMTLKKVTVQGQYTHTLGAPRNRGKEILIVDCEDRVGVTWKNDGAVRQPDFTDPNGKPLRNPAPVEYTLVMDKGLWKVSESDLLWDQPC